MCHLLLFYFAVPSPPLGGALCGLFLFWFCWFFFSSPSLRIPVSSLTFPTTEVLINAGCTPELLKFIALFPHCRSINSNVLFPVLCLTSQRSSAFLLEYLSVFKFVLLQHISPQFISLVQPEAVCCVISFLSSPADCNPSGRGRNRSEMLRISLRCSGSNKNQSSTSSGMFFQALRVPLAVPTANCCKHVGVSEQKVWTLILYPKMRPP